MRNNLPQYIGSWSHYYDKGIFTTKSAYHLFIDKMLPSSSGGKCSTIYCLLITIFSKNTSLILNGVCRGKDEEQIEHIFLKCK